MIKVINHFLLMLFVPGIMQITAVNAGSESPQNPEEVNILEQASENTLPGSEIAVTTASADLAARLTSPPEIKLISIEEVQWSDSSLGCPREGFMYAQVITPGYMLVFEAEGKQYQYHTDRRNNVVLCENQ